jgi:hypothetical protein
MAIIVNRDDVYENLPDEVQEDLNDSIILERLDDP